MSGVPGLLCLAEDEDVEEDDDDDEEDSDELDEYRSRLFRLTRCITEIEARRKVGGALERQSVFPN